MELIPVQYQLFRDEMGELVEKVRNGEAHVALFHYRKPVAVVISVKDYLLFLDRAKATLEQQALMDMTE